MFRLPVLKRPMATDLPAMLIPKGEIGRYTGMTPFSGIVRDDGDGPKVVRYCITSGTKDYRFCIPSMVD